MFALFAVTFMTKLLATQTVVSPPAPCGQTFLPTGFARCAVSAKLNLARCNQKPGAFLLWAFLYFMQEVNGVQLQKLCVLLSTAFILPCLSIVCKALHFASWDKIKRVGISFFVHGHTPFLCSVFIV